MKRYICDTNFILRYLLADNDKQFKKTQACFVQIREGAAEAFLMEAVFAEVIFVLSSHYSVPRNKISEVLQKLLSYKGLVADKSVLRLALDYYQGSNLHIVDCLIAARSCDSQAGLLSFDKELTKFVPNNL